MEDRLNKLVREFYLGADTAFDELFFLLRGRMCKRLQPYFRSLNFADIQDIVSDWFADFFKRVRHAREMAEIEGDLRNLSRAEIDGLKISYCTAEPNFDFRGTPFDAWLWKVLYKAALDLRRKYWRRQAKQIDIEKLDSPGEQMQRQWIIKKLREAREQQGLQDARIGGEALIDELSDEEIARLMQKIEDNLESALDAEQLLYFRVWREHGYDPPAKIVREVFLREQKREISDASISKLKKEFLRLSYLVSLENLADAKYMSNLFWRLIKGKEDEETFYPTMMERIWRVFIEDAEAVRESQSRISPRLWRTLNEAVRQNGQRGRINNLRSQILVAAYHYFRMRNASPRFCKLVDLYSEDRFGGEIRRLFSGGGATN